MASRRSSGPQRHGTHVQPSALTPAEARALSRSAPLTPAEFRALGRVADQRIDCLRAVLRADPGARPRPR